MRTKSFFRRVGGFLLAASMVFGVAVFSSGTAEAQRRGHRVVIVRPFGPYGFGRWGYGNPYWYGGYGYGYSYRYGHYVFSNSGSANEQGFNDGQKTGRDDGKKNKSFDPERSHYFQEAGFGNFAETYRDGFQRGYADGYRYANRG